MKYTWRALDNSLLQRTCENNEPREKIASFDFDDTLVTTSSGKRFPLNGDDWTVLFDCIPHRVSEITIRDKYESYSYLFLITYIYNFVFLLLLFFNRIFISSARFSHHLYWYDHGFRYKRGENLVHP